MLSSGWDYPNRLARDLSAADLPTCTCTHALALGPAKPFLASRPRFQVTHVVLKLVDESLESKAGRDASDLTQGGLF
jgi:hypothetical protein